MPDLQLFYKPVANELGFLDLNMSGADLATGNDLQTAVLVSLFTDRRALSDDRLPDPNESKRGWWADSVSEIVGDKIGSRMWLLHREKQTPETLNRAKEYAQEALNWLIEDGISNRVQVDAEWIRMGVLGLRIMIERPAESPVTFRFNYVWDQLDQVTPVTLIENNTLMTENLNNLQNEDGFNILLE
jgi:phage gp46-like protein